LGAALDDWAKQAGVALIWILPPSPVSTNAASCAEPAPRLALRAYDGCGGEAWANIPYGSFMPTSPAIYWALSQWVAQRLKHSGHRRLLDLCSGAGCLSLSLAADMDAILAVDRDHRALHALAETAALRGFDHLTTRAGKVGTILPRLRRVADRWDAALVNPMREPLGAEIKELAALGIKQVLYLGPSAVSAAKDARQLGQHGYRVEAVAGVDLHPGTAQILLALDLRCPQR
jgi:tRNA/tmRNA/rRNA uracil-C5-methylase (TrmA/RlmC/RlmD family)